MSSSLAQARCRVCHGTELRQFLDLGAQPPANALIRPEQIEAAEQRYPLALSHCPTCQLIQLTHIVRAAELFHQYVYFSSVSEAMTRHFAAYADDVATRFVPRDGLVVEMGSNDGILLRALIGRPVRILGVDPAANVAEQARARGVPTIADFFGERVARAILGEHGRAAAILGNNVFAHIDDLDDVMRGIDLLLEDDGVLVLEVPYAEDFLEHLEFDTVYHEHVSYFGVRPLAYLFERFGFELFDVRRQSVHGGSIRVFAQRKRPGARPVAPSVGELSALERRRDAEQPDRLQIFARDVAALRGKLIQLVRKLRAEGKRVVGYTAPAKGNVLLNYCQLGPADVEYLADATPAKQGLYSPGMKIPIRSPEHFRKDHPDYAILLAWNHKDEILGKESAYRAAGGRFILPVPAVEVV